MELTVLVHHVGRFHKHVKDQHNVLRSQVFVLAEDRWDLGCLRQGKLLDREPLLIVTILNGSFHLLIVVFIILSIIWIKFFEIWRVVHLTEPSLNILSDLIRVQFLTNGRDNFHIFLDREVSKGIWSKDSLE